MRCKISVMSVRLLEQPLSKIMMLFCCKHPIIVVMCCSGVYNCPDDTEQHTKNKVLLNGMS